jgi:hypothetical protein
MYLSIGVRTALLWSNWILKGGSVGVQNRNGGCIADSVLARNGAIQGFVGGKSGGFVTRNWVLNAEDMGARALRGFGLGVNQSEYGKGNHVVLEFNIAAHSLGSGNGQFAFKLGEPPDSPWKNQHRYYVARNNIAYNHGKGFLMAAPQALVMKSIYNNLAVCALPGTDQIRNRLVDSGDGTGEITPKLSFERNTYYTTNTEPFQFNGKKRTFADWQAGGRDSNSIMLGGVPALNAPNYSLADWSAANGGPHTEAEFMDYLWDRPIRTWAKIYSAADAAAAARAAYSPRE